jgi:hypothetical protein
MQTHDGDPALVPGARPRVARRQEHEGPHPVMAPGERPTGVLGVGSILHLQRTAGNAAVSRMLDDEPASPVLDVVGRGGGRPLEPQTRTFMESRLGQDFGDVRVHTDGAAGASAKAISAHAYTVGSDIVFQSGHYEPDTPAGQRVLAHELTHVVQQRSGPVDGTPADGGIRISDPSDRFEQAAEQSADMVMSGGPAAAETTAASAPAPLSAQREEDDSEPSAQTFAVQREQEEEETEEKLPTG